MTIISEVKITIPGFGELTLLPSFSALLEFEDKAGIGISECVTGIFNNKFSTKAAVAAVWAGYRGHLREQGNLDQAPSYEALGQAIVEGGLKTFFPQIVKFCCVAIAQDDAAVILEKEVKNESSEA